MNMVALLWDNPIVTKFRRSRFRRSQFVPAAVVVVVICLCIGFGGYVLKGFSNGSVMASTTVLQSIILVVMGASQISNAVGGARESGIIDYHRVSPMSPLALTLGFFLGAPLREYALYALTLPLSVFCVAAEAVTIGEFFQTIYAQLLTAWLIHGISLITSLTTKKPKSGGRGVVGLIVFIFFFSSFGISIFRSFRFTGYGEGEVGFFGVPLPWFVFYSLYAFPALFFLLLASVRKMRTERAHPFTKVESILAQLILALLLTGTFWGSTNYELSVLTILYALVFTGCLLTTTITPNQGEYLRGLRRAEREGRHHLKPWADWALNRVSVVCLAAIVLVAGSFFVETRATSAITWSGGVSVPFSYSITVATSVFVVMYVGLAFQAFQLLMPTRGSTMFALFLFFAWLVPLILGAILSGSSGNTVLAQGILSLSPIMGLAYAAGAGESESIRAAQAAVFLPAFIFAFVFNNLVVIGRRKLNSQAKREAKPNAAVEV